MPQVYWILLPDGERLPLNISLRCVENVSPETTSDKVAQGRHDANAQEMMRTEEFARMKQ